MDALNGVDRAVETLALVCFPFDLDTDHPFDSNARVDEPEIFEEGAAKADVLVVLQLQGGSEARQ
ncbi:MAG: hypothetical protein RhofKO_17190 [Rhodothermales bacterium]